MSLDFRKLVGDMDQVPKEVLSSIGVVEPDLPDAKSGEHLIAGNRMRQRGIAEGRFDTRNSVYPVSRVEAALFLMSGWVGLAVIGCAEPG